MSLKNVKGSRYHALILYETVRESTEVPFVFCFPGRSLALDPVLQVVSIRVSMLLGSA